MAKKLFKNLNLKQKTIIYLEEQGMESVESRSGKYVVMKSPTAFYFIGKSGGIRVNNRNAVAGSRSLTDKFRVVINSWSKVQDQKEWIVLD